MTRALLGLLLALGACGDNEVPGWHVARGALRAPDGRAAILRGVNLSGSQKAPPYLDDKTPADYARIRDAWGMNAIRFIMTWAAVEPDEGRYDDAYLDAVAERLAWADAAGLAVVLEMHEDVYGEGFGFDGAPRWTCDATRYAAFVPKDPWYLSSLDPNVTACIDDFYTTPERRQHFVDAWGHVAARLASAPAVIGFDMLNEPNWGTYPIFQFEQDRLLPLYVDIVAAVRASAPGWVAFVEPSASRNVGIATKLTALPFGNAMYAPHSYDANAEGGGGFNPMHRQKLLDAAMELAGEARAMGAGLWIGEYGGQAEAPGIVEYMTAQYDAAAQVAGSTMYWAYDKSDGYGLLAPDGSEKADLLGAVVKPYPERVAGEPLAYAFDTATQTFTLRYAPDRFSTLATEISVPARVYPGGFQVDCGGCTYELAPGAVRITTPPGSATAIISLHP